MNSKEIDYSYVYSNLYDGLVVYAKSILDNECDAEDAVQMSIVNMFESCTDVNDVGIYLRRSVKNTCININNSCRVRLSKNNVDLLSISSTEPCFLESKSRLKHVRSIVSAMPGKRRREVIFSKIMGMRNKEISDSLKISEKSVEAHITSAYKIIREKIKNNI